VILEAGGSLKNILDAKKLKVHEFLSDILGKNWGDFTPGAWHDGSECMLPAVPAALQLLGLEPHRLFLT